MLGFRKFCMSGAGASGRGGRVDVVEVSRLRVSRLRSYATTPQGGRASDQGGEAEGEEACEEYEATEGGGFQPRLSL